MIIEIRVYSVTFIPLYGSDARAGMRNAESMHNGNFFFRKKQSTLDAIGMGIEGLASTRPSSTVTLTAAPAESLLPQTS